MNPSAGGVFAPDLDYQPRGEWDFSRGKGVTLPAGQALSAPALDSPVISGEMSGAAVGDRTVKTDVLALNGTSIHAALASWQNPEDVAILILRAVLDVVTESAGASTLDVGVSAGSSPATSDTLLDGVSGAAAAVFDSMNPGLDSGANAHAQKVAVGKWITVAEASGDTTGLVGNLYISYVRC